MKKWLTCIKKYDIDELSDKDEVVILTKENQMNNETRKLLKDAVAGMFDRYIDEMVSDGFVRTESNYVPYGNTYVSRGDYIDDCDIDRIKERFVDEIKYDDDMVVEVLDEVGLDFNDNNRELVIEIAKGV